MNIMILRTKLLSKNHHKQNKLCEKWIYKCRCPKVNLISTIRLNILKCMDGFEESIHTFYDFYCRPPPQRPSNPKPFNFWGTRFAFSLEDFASPELLTAPPKSKSWSGVRERPCAW